MAIFGKLGIFLMQVVIVFAATLFKLLLCFVLLLLSAEIHFYLLSLLLYYADTLIFYFLPKIYLTFIL